VNHDKFNYEDHIDFIVYDSSLDANMSVGDIEKIALPFDGDPKYAGYAGQKLSDHCPVVGIIK
jgi:hypothetical protein